MADDKFGSISEIVDEFFKKSRETISRRNFLKLLIKHYFTQSDDILTEIDEVYNSNLRTFLVAKNLKDSKLSFDKLPGTSHLTKRLRSMHPKEVGRIGQMINELKDFVFTYKTFEVTKREVEQCLDQRLYSKYFYEKNQAHIDKVFYDSLHSRSDHLQFINNDL